MSETVTVDLDKYLEYKKCYDYAKSEQRTTDMYERKICELTFINNNLIIELRDEKRNTGIKLDEYNKAKRGSFSDKLNFLFSKE